MHTLHLLLVASGAVGWCAAGEIGIEPGAGTAGRFETIEFRLTLPRAHQDPFDPEEICVRLDVRTPSGAELSVPAFFCQEYERQNLAEGGRRTVWLYPRGAPGWKARFAPMEVGAYEARCAAKDRTGTLHSEAVRFECTPSTRRGHIRVSESDPRFFEHSTGEPFFAIGQNLAFIGEGQYVTLTRAEEIFALLARHGANYVRVWTCCKDWALAVEARKSAWGRSWDWKPGIVTLPAEGAGGASTTCVAIEGPMGTHREVSPSHRVALRPATAYALRGTIRFGAPSAPSAVRVSVGNRTCAVTPPATGSWAPFELPFSTGAEERWLPRTVLRLEGAGVAHAAGISLREAAGGPELLWEADVERPERGFYNPIDCAMLDAVVAAAERHGIYLHVCLLTRDLYMGALKDDASPAYARAIADAQKTLRYAVGRWGASTSIACWEYFNENDPGLPADRFYRELGTYLEQIDIYGHLRSTSAWGPSERDCRHAELDIADVHFYLRPGEKRLRDEVDAVLDRARFLRTHAPHKPALIGEIGMATEDWGQRPEARRSDELADIHNFLWASTLSGTSGTALPWWWEHLDQRDVYPLYQPLAGFLAGAPWTTAGFEPLVASVAPGEFRVAALRGKDRAYLWIFDPRASWANVVLRGAVPDMVRDTALEIPSLAAGRYRIEWWDPWQGRAIEERRLDHGGGPLRLAVPPFRRDVACRIVP